MEYKKLLDHIVELEARLFTAEKFINDTNKLNNLTIPSQNNIENELDKQRAIARKKYLGHP